jgi:hypothetical protein
MPSMYPTMTALAPGEIMRSKSRASEDRYTVTVHRDEAYAVIVLRDNQWEWVKSKRVNVRWHFWWYSPWSRVQHYREKYERLALELNEQDATDRRAIRGMSR